MNYQSGPCEVCGEHVNIEPGGDGGPSANGVQHDRCRRVQAPEKMAARKTAAIAAKAPLLAHAGLLPVVTTGDVERQRGERNEQQRLHLVEERAKRAATAKRTEELRQEVARAISPQILAMLDGRVAVYPEEHRESAWNAWLAEQRDGRLAAWCVEQDAHLARAARLRAKFAALSTSDRLAACDAFVAGRGPGDVVAMFWWARLGEAHRVPSNELRRLTPEGEVLAELPPLPERCAPRSKVPVKAPRQLSLPVAP